MESNFNNVTEVTEIYNLIILDESGSMESAKNETISGFNEVVQTIKSTQEEFRELQNFITLVSFNTMGIRTLLSSVPASALNEIKAKDYQPNAGTPLLDAIGFSCSRLRHDLDGKPNKKVLVTIMTDGYENASREYSLTMVRNLIEELRAEGWIFTFMGANIDVESVADSMSINNRTLYSTTEEGMKEVFEKEKFYRMKFHEKIHNRSKNIADYYDDDNLDTKKKNDKDE